MPGAAVCDALPLPCVRLPSVQPLGASRGDRITERVGRDLCGSSRRLGRGLRAAPAGAWPRGSASGVRSSGEKRVADPSAVPREGTGISTH